MQKIVLFYKFVPVTDPTMTMHWQRELCLRLLLKGRIIIADHGINGTLGGEISDITAYIKAMNQTREFKGIVYKWSSGTREDFPKLSIKVRSELVTLAPERPVDVYDSGTPLSPDAWHRYMAEHPEATILDARNAYESAIGTFRGAITPPIKTFKQIKQTVKSLPKDQPILTYCTGDIRCEYLSAYMKQQGFQEVYHLDGGIVSYGATYGDDGFWDGSCYVFDKRMKIAFSSDAKDIGRCVHCMQATSEQINCMESTCNRQFVVCLDCQAKAQTYCVDHLVAVQ